MRLLPGSVGFALHLRAALFGVVTYQPLMKFPLAKDPKVINQHHRLRTNVDRCLLLASADAVRSCPCTATPILSSRPFTSAKPSAPLRLHRGHRGAERFGKDQQAGAFKTRDIFKASVCCFPCVPSLFCFFPPLTLNYNESQQQHQRSLIA